MKKEVENIVAELAVKENTAKEIIKAVSTFSEKIKEFEELAKIEVTSEDQVEEMKQAKTNRLFIKNTRLEGEKFFKAKRTEVQDRKSEYDKEDKAWLKISQHFESVSKGFEVKLEKAEKFAEEAQQLRLEKLVAKRFEKLSAVCDNPEDYPLDSMSDKAFEDILESLQLRKSKKEQEEIEAQLETERLESERLLKEKLAEKLQAKRYNDLEKYSQHGPTVDMLKLHELGAEYFDTILAKKKYAYEEYTKEQANKETERLAQQEKLQKAEEERKKLQAELKLKTDAEEKTRKEEEIRAKVFAKASDKEKLSLWISSFNLPISDFLDFEEMSGESKNVLSDILIKFNGFLTWSKNEISKL